MANRRTTLGPGYEASLSPNVENNLGNILSRQSAVTFSEQEYSPSVQPIQVSVEDP